MLILRIVMTYERKSLISYISFFLNAMDENKIEDFVKRSNISCHSHLCTEQLIYISAISMLQESAQLFGTQI